MLDVGFWELVLLALIVLIVAGPERLPGIVRGVGRWTGRAKAIARGLKAEFDREVDNLERRERETQSGTTPPSSEDTARRNEQDRQ